MIVAAAPARGQYAQPLFLEAARDPGRADVAKTARQLALGGIEAVSGTADEAAVSPGLLTAGTPAVDLVFSFGHFRYARQELTNTAAQLPPRDPARTLSATSSRPVGYFAVAARRSRWSIAGFLDASSRYAQAFETRKAPVFGLALFPTLIQEDASGRASVTQSLTRTGGAIAIGGRRAGAGAGLYLVHFRHDIDALTSIEIGSSSFSDPVFRTRCCVPDSDRVAFDGWSAGLSVSGHYAPIPHLRVTARWRRDPAFAADRHGSREQDATVQRVELDLPDAFAAGVVVTLRRTILAAEAGREMYAGTFSPAGRTSDPNQICGRLRNEYSDYCYGWNFPYHDTRDVTVLRAGIEHAVPAGRAHLLLRTGIAREPGYTLARRATDPSTARSFEFPPPPIVAPFEPPREDLTWLSLGGAWSWARAEIGVGLSWTDNQKRALVDFRLHR